MAEERSSRKRSWCATAGVSTRSSPFRCKQLCHEDTKARRKSNSEWNSPHQRNQSMHIDRCALQIQFCISSCLRGEAVSLRDFDNDLAQLRVRFHVRLGGRQL